MFGGGGGDGVGVVAHIQVHLALVLSAAELLPPKHYHPRRLLWLFEWTGEETSNNCNKPDNVATVGQSHVRGGTVGLLSNDGEHEVTI